jgi:hypothetical protein
MVTGRDGRQFSTGSIDPTIITTTTTSTSTSILL